MFDEIKKAVTMREIADKYGIEINRSDFAHCPFHTDNTASMKLYDHSFYCFGCGKGGDITDFVAELYGISLYQAALRINDDFGLQLTSKKSKADKSEIMKRRAKEKKEREAFEKDYLEKCEEYKSINRSLMDETDEWKKAEMIARLDYLDYFFDETHWR